MSLSSSLALSSLDTLPTQLAILDAGGEIVYTNRAWREFGTENDYEGDARSLGVNYLAVCDLSADESAGTAAGGIRAVLDGDREEFSMEYPCHSPEKRRWFTMRATRFSHDGETYVQVVHLDITERKLAELEVDEKAARLKNVAGILSHDIRNPLSVALGYAESLRDEGVATDRVGRVVDALERIDDIISDALMLARHDTVEETSVVHLREQAETAWGHVDTGDASLVVADSFGFRADPTLLSHVFENLFRNAVEHGRPDDAADSLTVTVGRLDGKDSADGDGFYVEDDGVGVPADDRREVFEAGYTSSATGTGLGLAIVTQVVDAHGWCIEATESADGGARFEVTGVELAD